MILSLYALSPFRGPILEIIAQPPIIAPPPASLVAVSQTTLALERLHRHRQLIGGFSGKAIRQIVYKSHSHNGGG